MRIIVEKTGRVIPANRLTRSVFRTDLIPIPVNAEFSVVLDDDLEKSLIDGAIVLAGEEGTRLTIIKVSKLDTQMVVQDKRIKIASFIAVLAGCETLIDPLSKAVILDDTSFANAYRACGCKMKFDKDIPLINFISAYGAIPTIEVAHCLQQESAAIYFSNGKLNVQRLRKFFMQEPLLTIDSSAVAWVSNAKVEQNKVAAFMSIADDGSVVEGTQKANTPVKYVANADARRLKNMNEILVTRGSVTRPMNMSVNAGEILLINEKKYLILTAAHEFQSGALGGGFVNASRFWIASMSA